MEPIEDLLRHELRRSDAVLPVSRDVLLARVKRIRRRRHAVAAGLAAVLIGATALTTLNLSGSAGQTPGNAPPQVNVKLFNVVFTDANHGYALQRRCLTGGPGSREQCRTQLLATADAGDSWQERALPDEAAVEAALADTVWDLRSVFHRSLMLWVDAPGIVAVGGRDLRYWTTANGGVTWQESRTPRSEVAQRGRVTTFSPDDKLVTVKNPPVWQEETLKAIYGMVAATDGSVWVPGASLAGVYYVTRDLGETWHTATFPRAIDIRWISTLDGRNVFAVYRDDTTDRLVRSTDGGSSWEQVSGMPEGSRGGSRGLVLPNGDLLIINVAEAGTLMRVKAGSSTAEHIAAVPNYAHSNLLFVTGGVPVAFGGADAYNDPGWGSAASISADNGLTWFPIPTAPQ